MEETSNTDRLELPDDHKLFNIAYWSKTISWVIVILGVLNLIFDIAGTTLNSAFFSTGNHPLWLSGTVLSSITSLISIAFYFFILQAIGEILYLVIDIKEHLLNQEN